MVLRRGPTFSSYLCDLLDCATPDTVDGKSLLPLITKERMAIRDDIYFAYKKYQRGYRKGDWKLIRYDVKGKRHTQLFDLSKDPWETKDLAGQSQHEDTVRTLTRALQQRMKECSDPVILD